LTSRTLVTSAFLFLTGPLVERTPEEPLHDQGRVRPTRKLEAYANREGPPLLLGLRRPHAQMPGEDEQRAGLSLEVEAANALDAHLIGHQFLPCQCLFQERTVLALGDVVEAGTGNRETRTSAEGPGRLVRVGDESALLALERKALARRNAGTHEVADGSIPQVGLPRVEVDQLEARGDVLEGSGELARVPGEMLEDRVVCAELARRFPAGPPVAPVRADVALEPPVALVVPRALGSEQREERVLHVPPQEILDDPTLAVGQVPETLIVEVVDGAVLPHEGNALAQAIQSWPTQVAHGQLEGVAPGEATVERLAREADGLDLELLVMEPHRTPSWHAHVLDRDALAILPAGETDLGLLDARFHGEHPGRFGTRELALGHAVNAIVPPILEVAVDQ